MTTTRERKVTANGLAHHVIEWGEPNDAPSVVLCHGFLDIAWGFRDVGSKLSSLGLHAIAFDWRGHGESDWTGPGGYYHFPDYLLDLHELLPQLTPRPCHLVGHSMGGTVVTLFTATHPDAVVSLTLLEGLGPPAPPPLDGPTRIRRWLHAVDRARTKHGTVADVDEALARMRRYTPDVPDELGRFLAEKSTEALPEGGRRFRFDPLHRTPSAYGFDPERFLEFVRAVSVPTLCVVGSRGMRTGDDARRYAALRDARQVELPDTGHMLQWTAPDAVCDALLPFWASMNDGRAQGADWA